MKALKRITILFLALILLVGMAACKKAEPTTTAAPTTTKAPGTDPTTAGPTTAAPTTATPTTTLAPTTPAPTESGVESTDPVTEPTTAGPTEPGTTTTTVPGTTPGATTAPTTTVPGTTPGGTTTPTTAQPTTAVPTTAPPVTTGGPTTTFTTKPLKLSLGLPEAYNVTSETLVKNFKAKYPNITVTIDESDWGTFTSGLAAKIAAKTAPDIWFQENAKILGYGKDGVATDLAPYIARDINANDFAPALFSAKVGDKVWGVPHGSNPIALAYNKKIFDNAKEPYPTDNWTFDDMIRVAKKLNSDNTYGFLTTVNITQGWFPWIKGAGGNCLDSTLTKADFLNPKTKEGVAKWANTYLVDKIAPDTAIATNVLFGTGKGAMVFMQYSETANANKTYPRLDYDTVMIPKATDGSGKRYVINIFNSWLINSAATQDSKDAAWQFIKYYLSAEGQDEVAILGAALPIRKSSASKLDTTTKPKNKAAFTKGVEVGGYTMDETPAWDLWRRPTNTTMMAIYEGTKTVEEGLAEIQASVQKILDDNK